MNREEAAGILTVLSMDRIEKMCTDTRISAFGNAAELCAIVNAKNGACPEDCTFCAQSRTEGTPMLPVEEIVEAHRTNSIAGVHRFSMVTSGRGLRGEELEQICEAAALSRANGLLCASLGILGFSELQKLKNAGVTRYHHNLETSQAFFPSVCTTHSFDERVITLRRAKLAGMSVCSGGIVGMGESDEDRLDLAFSLKELEVDSIALNFYIPVDGATAVAEHLPEEKLLRIIGMFRMVNPKAELRICAGRSQLGKSVEKMFSFGATGLMTGTLLTTGGSLPASDLDLILRAGLTL
ncbi:MAG: biotin synthase BioB [Candidatus Fermentibacteraceae bacterium]|nr:biotin synthase BioB [Candidatus Fermentibacteraceae bacterium]